MARGPWKKGTNPTLRRSRTVGVALTEGEYVQFESLCRARGISMSSLLRSLILCELKKANCTESGQPHPADTAAG